MRGDIFFSVVIPLYNKECSVVNTIKSVLAQDYLCYEVLVVNDGSTDNSLELVRSIDDARVRVFNIPNGGVSRARNLGVKEAKGSYIAFLDADDLWAPWHLEELRSLICSFPGCAIYSTGHQILRDGNYFSPRGVLPPDFFGILPNFFKAFQAGLGLINSSTACIQKGIFERIGGFPVGVKKGEDVYVWIRAAFYGQVAFSSRCSAVYNQEAESRSGYIVSAEYPYYIKWLDKIVGSNELPEHIDRRDVISFARHCIVINSAGAALIGAKDSVAGMRGLDISQSLSMKIYFYILGLIPVSFLQLAKKLRHRKSKGSWG